MNAQSEGAVNRAREGLDSSCFDGVGFTYTLEQEQDADDDNDLGEFLLARSACSWNEEIPMISALCTPSVQGVKAGATIVVCAVTVINPEEGDAVVVSALDFSLLANTRAFEADLEVSKRVDPLMDIASQPIKLRAGDAAQFVVVFDVRRMWRIKTKS